MMTFQLNVDMVGFQYRFLYYSGIFFLFQRQELALFICIYGGRDICAIGHMQLTDLRSKFSPSTV